MSELFLRALEPDDYIATHQWRLDDATWDAVVGEKRFVSLETERKWVLSAMEKHDAGDCYRLVLCYGTAEDHEVIGLYTAAKVNESPRIYELGCILDPGVRGKGIFTESFNALAEYLFNTHNAHRLEIVFLENNPISRKSAERIGMQHEGVLRQAAFKNGQFLDLHQYGMLASDWRSRQQA